MTTRYRLDLAYDGHGPARLYEFNYIDIPGRRFRGVMADEVQKLRPDAVTMMESGFMAVDYGALGLEMTQVDGDVV